MTKAEFEERFDKIKQIGKGGFSSVWEYYDKKNHSEVAVKISACVDKDDFDDKMDEV
jgi:serine/threonine protein kinase